MMNRTTCTLVWLSGWLTAACSGWAAHPLPNIVVFLMDDMGIGDCKAYDEHCQIDLPNLERLADQGMVFTDAHSPAAVCAPTRYSILTGNYPWRGRDPDGTWGFQLKSQILHGQMTVAELLHRRKYRTSFFGKEHLGGAFYLKATGEPVDRWKYTFDEVDWSRPMPQGLQTKGFDYTYSLPNGIQNMPYAFFRNGLLQGDPAQLRTWEKGDYGTSKIKADGYGVADWDSSQAGPILTREALAFLDEHFAANQRDGARRPFLVYYSSQSCHTPHSPPETLDGTQIKGASGLTDHLDMIIEADVTLGLLMDRIDRAGETANTLFLFTSDNGGLSWDPPAPDRTTHRSSGDLRGGKAQIWEGGHRVPLIARWGDGTPAGSRIPPGTRCNALVGGQDIFATLAELLDVATGPEQGLDSFSFLGHLMGDPQAPCRRHMLIQSNIEDVPFQRRMKIFRDGPWKLITSKDHAPRHLYNLEADPQETTDLFANPEHKERIARMHDAYLEAINSKRSVPVGAGRMPAPLSLQSHRLVPDPDDPTAVDMRPHTVELPAGWKQKTSDWDDAWRIAVRGPVAPRREAELKLVARPEGWNLYDKLWIVIDVTNRGDEEVLVRLGTDTWKGQLGADVIAPDESRLIPALIYRELKEEHAYLKERLPGIYGMPGGHVEHWRRTDVSAVPEVLVHLSSYGTEIKLVLKAPRAVTDFAPPSEAVLADGFIPYVDRFGQARHDQWDGKITSAADLQARAAEETETLRTRPRPAAWNRYGGWANGPQREATGHFRTEKVNGAWWLVDPEGRLFWSFGVTGIAVHDPHVRSPFENNLRLKYGANWADTVAERVHRRMAAWGLNTMGNWSTPEATRLGKTPYVQAIHWDRPSLYPGRTKFQAPFPDLYHPGFAHHLGERMAMEVGLTTDDPWCIGYFVDNELPFKSLRSIAAMVKQAPATAYSKQAMLRQLQTTYGSVQKLNRAWNTIYDSWDGFLADQELPDTEAYRKDAGTFGRAFLRYYYQTCRDEVKKAAPDTLYLGNRIHEKHPEIIEICGEYADVIGINFYQYSPVVLDILQETRVDKPFLIGEFHFGTLTEQGVWGPGLMPSTDLDHAARLMTRYVHDALADPRLVGAHWFQFRDQPVSGRGDGENYRIGFVSITDTPHHAMIDASRTLGSEMYPWRFNRFQESHPITTGLDMTHSPAPIPFEAFAHFERLTPETPPFYCPPPEWAAAAHAMVEGDTVYYLWARRRTGNSWVLMHSTAPVADPAAVTHDLRNPVLMPSGEGFDAHTVEYPFPFRNPHDQKLYAYYLGRKQRPPKQTGLLVSDGDFGHWTRVRTRPVIAIETPFESQGSSHPSVTVVDDTIHILYTGESDKPPVLCHATAPVSDPATVTKDPTNPIFQGSGQAWDSRGVREAEILKGPVYYHIFYGGYDGTTWRAGHIRTRDFRRFEPNPYNPILSPSTDPEAWDCDGILTPQVFEANGTYYMLYAGYKGREWQSGLAAARKKGDAS